MKFMFQGLSFALTLSVAAFLLAEPIKQDRPAQNSADSNSNVPVYLPGDQTGAWLFPPMLYSIDEPSLLDASKDKNIHAYRLCIFSSVPTREAAIRVVINLDGTGQVFSAISAYGRPPGFARANLPVSMADVELFLQLVNTAGFWDMPSIEQKPNRPRVYELDGSMWMIEGVRGGTFHYVYRQNPQPGSFTEVARNLVGSLAKIDGSLLSIPEYIPSNLQESSRKRANEKK